MRKGRYSAEVTEGPHQINFRLINFAAMRRALDLREAVIPRCNAVIETAASIVVTVRRFSLDHGTDFATTVAGAPVNMPTHAHGQGYSDNNFLIPELIS